MKKITTTGLVITGLFFFSIFLPVQADTNPPQVVYATPTPGADGRIIYVVKPADNCISISLLTGVQLDELRRLNNLDEACTLQEGQQLLIGIAEKPPQQATATPIGQVPTPTLPPGTGDICVYLFNDINGNAIPDGSETALAGGAISVTDREGRISLTGETNAVEAVCFEALIEGDYNISVAVPEGYNATTLLNYPLTLNGGDTSILDFGAQAGSQLIEPAPGEGGRSPLLGLIGAALILGGAGLGFYVARMARNR